MAGTKRKATSQAQKSSKRAARSPSSSENEAFQSDDGEDLLARAQSMMDDIDGDNDDDSEDDEIEAASDEEGKGFEDLEADGGEDEDVEMDGGEGSDARPRRKHQGLYKAPTMEEVQALKETGELFKSNVFKMQIDALLEQTAPPPPPPALASALHSLRAHLLALPTVKPLPPATARKKAGFAFPYPDPPKDVQWKLAFDNPKDVQVVGSWALRTGVKKKGEAKGWEVGVGVVMPEELFQEKDYQNDRFFQKQAYYLSVIAASINKSKALGLSVSAHLRNDDARLPSLLLTSRKDSANPLPSSLHIHLLPLLSTHSPLRPTQKLSPARLSPLTSHALILPSLILPHLVHLHALAESSPAFREAVRLVKIWATQRGLPWIAEEGAEWVICALVGGEEPVGNGKPRGRLGRGLSYYQVFRGAIDFLAKHDFTAEPVFMKLIPCSRPLPREDFTSTSSGVLVDPTGTLNVVAHVIPEDLELIRHEAAVTLKLLDDTQDRFDDTLLRNLREPTVKFDLTARVDIPSFLLSQSSEGSDAASSHSDLRIRLSSVLRRALGNRARAISLTLPRDSTTAVLGIVLDPAHTARLVDHGPPAEDKEGGEVFRKFWGAKSELRRFKDGRITESVVWDAGLTAGWESRGLVPVHVVRWILRQHFGIADVEFVAEDFAGVLARPSVQGVPRQADFSAALRAYDELQKALRDMEGLPLSVLNVSPASPLLRYTSAFPPSPVDPSAFGTIPDAAKYIPVADIVLQFESSGRWPDDLLAIQRMKLAFLEATARQVMDALPGTRAQVVLDWPVSNEMADRCALELVTGDGYAFRARIHHDRERVLLERIIADKKNQLESHRKQAQLAHDIHLTSFNRRPRHHAAIATVHHLYPSFSHTVRLVQRWFAAHLLSPHVAPELVELLVAYVYLDPGAFQPPVSGATGFARTVLLLARWKWRTEPLLVPLFSAAAQEEAGRVAFPLDKRERAEKAFEKLRSADPAMNQATMVIATEADTAGRWWAGGKPSRLVAARITQLARATYAALESGAVDGSLDVMSLYKTPLTDYDFLINLNPAVLTRHVDALFADESVLASKTVFKNLPASAENSVYGDEVRVDFDPASELLRDLERIHGDSAVFFHDRLGGAVIAGLWNPALREGRRWKVNLGFSSMPSNKGDQELGATVELNTGAVLNEIERMGEGLVAGVERLKQ